MDFIVDTDFHIFDKLLEKRPDVSADNLKKDLEKYYLPYVKKLIDLKKQKNSSDGLVVGVSAIQGAGKTTQGEVLEILLKHMGYSSVSRSIDDHYMTHKQLCELRTRDPRFIRRGVTHDIPLAILDLKDLKTMEKDRPVLVSGYFKGAHHGDGDRFKWVNLEKDISLEAKVSDELLTVDKTQQTVKALKVNAINYRDQKVDAPISNMGSFIPLMEHLLPDDLINFLRGVDGQDVLITEADESNVKFSSNGQEIIVLKKDLPNGWRLINEKPDFIFYDGWMLGARRVEEESIFDGDLPALETPESKQFAKDVNRKLTDYEPLWQMIDFLTVLYVANYQMSLQWRDQAEEVLRQKGEGMSHDEIREFVYYFWRSVHPGIHIKNLAHDSQNTDQVVLINDDHSVGEILTPDQARANLP